MKAFIIVAVLAASSCADDGGHPYISPSTLIRECIAKGGTPQYTSDKYGRVVQYFGCVGGAT